MNIKQLKTKIKNRKPMGEKKKTLLKGLLFGFLAGGLATITAVGVVGCAMTQGKAQENEPTQKSLTPRNVPVGDSVTISAGPYTFRQNLPTIGDWGYCHIDFTCGFSQYDSIVFNSASNFISFDYDGEGGPEIWRDGVWSYDTYRYIIVTSPAPFTSDNPFYVWFLEATSEEIEVSSSSEESSAESTSGEQSSESGGASSSVENSTIEEVSKSFALQFGESNPFSAWAINPSNEEPASNYDSGAPWLLYTGGPSSATMGMVDSKYTIYNVGDFYVDGNPAQTFDAIAITTLTLSPDNSFVVGGASEAQLVGEDAYNKGAFIVANAYYLNTAAETRVKVLDFATTSAKLGSEQVNALTGPAWLNVGFRNIVYVGENPNLEINGYDAPAAWWLKNNALSSSAAVATMLLGNAETGVFGLLASAFSGIGGILGIAIIPGLTIGTLLFIPLVVIVIFAIIKILNK